MKRIYIIIILVASMFSQNQTAHSSSSGFSQNQVTLSGGINWGTIKYNNSDVPDEVDIHYRSGLNIGVETTQGKIKLGVAYIQRGAELIVDVDAGFIDPIYSGLGELTLSGYDELNYLSAYGFLPIVNQRSFTASAGFQIGKMISGKTQMTLTDPNNITGYGYGYSETKNQKLDEDYFNIDYGILIAIDLKIAPKINCRGSYYIGLGDVLAGFTSSDGNYKFQGIGINLLYNLK